MQTVYIPTPIRELPKDDNPYFYYTIDEVPTSLGAAHFLPEVGEFDLDNEFQAQPTHWLKPISLSTLIEEQVKELKTEISRLNEENKQLRQSSSDQYNSLNGINTVMCESWMIKDYPFGRKDGNKIMDILNKWADKY